MNRALLFHLTLVLLFAASVGRSQTYLDTIIFGNTASEGDHSFTGANTFIITNSVVSPAQTARRSSTNNPATVDGGPLTFTLAVDPVWRNYFTIKLWGGDDSSSVYEQDSDMGRLYLYIPASNYVASATTNYQIGYRHEGDYICLNAAAYKPPLPGRFFYSTTLLPLWMTQGRTNLTFTIQPTGRIYDLGSGGPPDGNYQFNMITNSRSIYEAYTHVDPILNPVREVQGSAPAVTILPSPTVSTMSPGGTFYNGISNYLSGRMSANVTNFTTTDVLQLAKAYAISNFLVTYQNPATVTKVIAAVDYFATNYFSNPGSAVSADGNEGWGGRFGNLGWAIHLLLPQLQGSLGVTNNYGAGGTITRSRAWGTILQASRDYGRTNRDSWDLSNQGLIANTSIYWANRGMLDLTNANAFTETNAQRYLLEAIGLSPWLGSDLPEGGSDYFHGTNYFMVTGKGLTREWGYVGTAYGEMQFYAADFYQWTTNPAFLTQAVKMVKARANFRRPGMEVSGGSYYQDMEGIGLLAWRGADESDTEYADEQAYGDRSAWALGMRVAAVTLDTNAIGYAKQMLADNQYFNNLTADASFYTTIGSQIDSRDTLNAFADYQTVVNAPDSEVRLPMTSGQPDFAWADEDDGVVVIKHNGEKLWISTYWQAKAGTGVNGIGRFYDSTTNFDRYGVLETSPQINFSGSFYSRPNLMDKPEENFYVPPDDPLQAYQGELLPLAASDSLATDNQPFLGNALFWACRYGNYLIGINRSASESYQLQVPSDFTSATNLINSQNVAAPVYVAPESTVVLYLNSATDSCPPPQAPLSLNAVGNATPEISLNWNAASGATGYNVKRATTGGGPYSTIANVTTTNYTDTSVTRGVSYYYVVSGTNSCGESYYNSMEAVASAGLPSPWFDVDIGTVGASGGAAYNNTGTFTVEGAGSDIGGTADSFNFSYVNVTNNSAIIARLAAEQVSGSDLDKVGVMMRETTNANSQVQGLILDLELSEARFPMRYGTGSSMIWQQIPNTFAAPLWFELTRTNNTFTGYVSTNSVIWIPVGTNTIPFAANYLVGLAVCSRTTSALDVSTFDNVTTAAWSSPFPDPPTGITAVVGDAQDTLTWNASTNADLYTVCRSTTNGGPYSIVANNLNVLTFTDAGVANGTTYYYVVTSSNPVGESGYSTQVSVQPVSLSATSLDFRVSGVQIQLFWPLDHTGWQLQTQTNSLNFGIGTNWTTVTGSEATNQISIPVNLTNCSVFFRLVYLLP
jgi:hypothetical protein